MKILENIRKNSLKREKLSLISDNKSFCLYKISILCKNQKNIRKNNGMEIYLEFSIDPSI